MKVAAVVLAAGSGSRFGADKVVLSLGGKPLWRWSFDSLNAHPEISSVGVVCPAGREPEFASLAPGATFVVPGGSNRMESSKLGFEAIENQAEIVLFHDAARPIVDHEVVSRVIAGTVAVGAAGPAVEAVDTVRFQNENASHVLLDRRRIMLMQTPQGARVETLRAAFAQADLTSITDELGLVESIGAPTTLVEGIHDAFKITVPADFARLGAHFGFGETRTGIGYDVHAFSKDPDRPLWLGGVHFPGERGLEGHSDADVLLHAIVDALMGACALGDIGQHFHNTDPTWKNAASSGFLRFAIELLAKHGWQTRNIDATLIAEHPKIMPRSEEIRAQIALTTGLHTSQIGLKATTNEGLGSIGRGEGIAAYAIATVFRSP